MKQFIIIIILREVFTCPVSLQVTVEQPQCPYQTIKYEPQHDKTNKMSVRPTKTQISLGICPVWSESSLSAWRKLGTLATHWAHSEDWSDWANAQADLSLCWAHTYFCWFCHVVAHMQVAAYCTWLLTWQAVSHSFWGYGWCCKYILKWFKNA